LERRTRSRQGGFVKIGVYSWVVSETVFDYLKLKMFSTMMAYYFIAEGVDKVNDDQKDSNVGRPPHYAQPPINFFLAV
jgi:hypothetical protein